MSSSSSSGKGRKKGDMVGWPDYAGEYLPRDMVNTFVEFVTPEVAFDRRMVFDQNPTEYARLCLKVFRGQSRRHQLLRYMVECFSDDWFDITNVVEFQTALSEDSSLRTVLYLQQLIGGDNVDASRDSVSFLCRLLQIPNDSVVCSKDVESFISWGIGAMKEHSDKGLRLRGMNGMINVLRVPAYRSMFVGLNGLAVVSDIIRRQIQDNISSGSTLYKALLILWLLSFEKTEVGKYFLHSPTLLNDLMKVLIMEGKEKYTRLALSTLKNLGERTSGAAGRMVELEGSKVAQTLSTKKFKDEDITKDLEIWTTQLDLNMDVITSWPRYREQVLSGRLEWSPNHRSELFWHQNIHEFKNNNYEIVRKLVEILFVADSNADPTSQAIAAHDIGMFVQLYPTGRQLAQQLKVKHKLMQLLTSVHPDVQKEALRCTQHLLLRRA